MDKLLRWFDEHGRDLPWRLSRDPYRILVSEIMLQQTQVLRVLSFYRAWLKIFPTWKRLAGASNAEVIHAWAGLGYNRRALALRDIARQVVERGVPTTREGWLSMKGIGPYTSAALAAFSLHKRILPIDTNIRRVAGRLLLGKPFPQPSDDERIAKKTDEILPRTGRFYDIPQALFDLATAVCVKNPACQTCPLRTDCPSASKFLSGRVRIPKAMAKKAKESKHRDKPHPDRIYRGRILKVVRETKDGLPVRRIGPQVDPEFDRKKDETWIFKMVERMKKDGLVEEREGRIWLPR